MSPNPIRTAEFRFVVTLHIGSTRRRRFAQYGPKAEWYKRHRTQRFRDLDRNLDRRLKELMHN